MELGLEIIIPNSMELDWVSMEIIKGKARDDPPSARRILHVPGAWFLVGPTPIQH
jgi:hypothetical protein